MKNIKSLIAYLLVAVFLLGSIAASANTLPKNTDSQPIECSVTHGALDSN
ncbi:hypothetical protein JAO76_01230 [Pontibacter sp. BT310]|uniref:Uncharacterized protein n=1 Tax=Pontibacter populi TaxID=890055 RepID=A0ABS6X6M3_9BACT|nr:MULTISPECIES: hypothetical protein [Pontibacter]MBJ6116793.1 hypothetical protein [Pontibacter sp. BT310]MBR0569215.1 hypothetical protein [Microvirga sp. STS03]MBW3363646.1 hypothetical protein [Pontibacter populi]